MPNDELVQRVRRQLPDDAHVRMFDAALAALAGDNPLRAQHFSTTLRELFGHVLSSQAPNSLVLRCAWYKQEKGAHGPTRRQRALYLSRGGLSDDFIRDDLELDPGAFHEELKSAFDELSENVHARPDAIPTEPNKIEEFANRAIGSFGEIFDVVDDVRSEIEHAIEPSLQKEAAAVFIRETIQNIDIIAGSNYTTEGVFFEETAVEDIGPEFIKYRVTGTVDVTLHHGGRSDPAQIEETFPFSCTVVAKVSAPFAFLGDMTEMEVDTSAWHGGQEEKSDASQLKRN